MAYGSLMRIQSLPPFKITMTGPDGPYELAYSRVDDWDGIVQVEIKGVAMTWHVERFNHEEGQISLSGMTVGSDAVWGDQFWFQLSLSAVPVRIDYWGNQVLWRADYSPTVV